MNDRQLRHIVTGLGGSSGGVPHEDAFTITAASEIMAILCLARDLSDLKARLGRIVVGRDVRGSVVTAAQLHAEGALCALLRDALLPNLVQTLEGTPALIHGGPFANIAHGCNSVRATRLALAHAEYAVTEAGFGADLGAEKFIDIKCRAGNLRPSAVVLVATVRALKAHGGAKGDALAREDLSALRAGLPNLTRHLQNIREVYKLPAVVAINRFSSDTEEELSLIHQACSAENAACALMEAWAHGGAGAEALASAVIRAAQTPSESAEPSFAYPLGASYEKKLSLLAKGVYGASGVEYAPGVRGALRRFEAEGYSGLPICVAKTQYSLSDNPKLLGRPENFTITVREARLSAGAGFVVVATGEIISMPGLPKVPSAEQIDVDSAGNITGLF